MGHYSKSVEQLPRVSVIIPVRNERDYIGRCLDSILAQDYPNIAEILVIEGDPHI